MPGKRVQFDDETWKAIDALLSADGTTLKRNPPLGFKSGLYSAKRCCDGVLKSDGFGTGP